MYIALMSHDNKKELMVQFCSAYAGLLSRHNLCATNTTGRMVADATGLNVHLFLSCQHGGSQQIGARIAYNEMDMVLFFVDPNSSSMEEEVLYISRLCDQSWCWAWTGAIWIGAISSIPSTNITSDPPFLLTFGARAYYNSTNTGIPRRG